MRKQASDSLITIGKGQDKMPRNTGNKNGKINLESSLEDLNAEVEQEQTGDSVTTSQFSDYAENAGENQADVNAAKDDKEANDEAERKKAARKAATEANNRMKNAFHSELDNGAPEMSDDVKKQIENYNYFCSQTFKMVAIVVNRAPVPQIKNVVRKNTKNDQGGIYLNSAKEAEYKKEALEKKSNPSYKRRPVEEFVRYQIVTNYKYSSVGTIKGYVISYPKGALLPPEKILQGDVQEAMEVASKSNEFEYALVEPAAFKVILNTCCGLKMKEVSTVDNPTKRFKTISTGTPMIELVPKLVKNKDTQQLVMEPKIKSTKRSKLVVQTNCIPLKFPKLVLLDNLTEADLTYQAIVEQLRTVVNKNAGEIDERSNKRIRNISPATRELFGLKEIYDTDTLQPADNVTFQGVISAQGKLGEGKFSALKLDHWCYVDEQTGSPLPETTNYVQEYVKGKEGKGYSPVTMSLAPNGTSDGNGIYYNYDFLINQGYTAAAELKGKYPIEQLIEDLGTISSKNNARKSSKSGKGKTSSNLDSSDMFKLNSIAFSTKGSKYGNQFEELKSASEAILRLNTKSTVKTLQKNMAESGTVQDL